MKVIVSIHEPQIEDPKRAVALLLNVTKGRAIVYGRDQVTIEDLPILINIVLDSCPDDRSLVIKEMLKLGVDDCALKTKDICKTLNVGTNKALQTMENLKILKIAEEARVPSGYQGGQPSHAITLSQDIKKLLHNSGVVRFFSENDGDIEEKT